MSGQHTQGRLLAATNYAQTELRDEAGNLVAVVAAYHTQTELRDEAGNLVAVVAAYHPQDALRMAAAWNACDGITTGNLQTAPGYLAAIAGFHEQRGLAMEARAQRDELLRARQVLGAERISLEAQRDELLAALQAIADAGEADASQLRNDAKCAIEAYEDDAKARRLGLRGNNETTAGTPGQPS